MNEIREIKNEKLGESYYTINHKSGLKILVYPKANYTSSYAIFGTRYGSIDTQFRTRGESAYTCVPEGIAHFLEHKLFESEDLDAFQRYAKTGASANAYTSFDKTCYLFSCSGDFKASLEILLDFVTHPYFTPETVQKEQGIIGQEIKMCRDEPSWEVLFQLLRCMYKEHPVRIDIAGTVESISEITAELLYKCYNTFYNLSNMVLCVVGNTDCETVLSVADRILKEQPETKIERKFHREASGVVAQYAETTLPVAVPVFAIGFKEDVKAPERTLKEALCSHILLELIAGKTSALYTEMLEEGLINTAFGFEFFEGYGYAALLFSGESRDPQAVRNKIVAQIEKLKTSGIPESDFERIRRKLYGRSIFGFNDIEAIANDMVAAYFSGEDIFAEGEILRSLTKDEVMARLHASINTESCALSVIKGE